MEIRGCYKLRCFLSNILGISFIALIIIALCYGCGKNTEKVETSVATEKSDTVEFTGNSDNYEVLTHVFLSLCMTVPKSDIDSLALKWFIYGDNEATEFLFKSCITDATTPFDISPVDLLSLCLYVKDNLKTRNSYKSGKEEFSLDELRSKINLLVDSLKTITFVNNIGTLKEPNPSNLNIPKKHLFFDWYLSDPNYELPDEDIRTLKALCGNKHCLSQLLISEESRNNPARVALYLNNIARKYNNTALIRKGALLMLNRLPFNSQYLPASINVLDKAATLGDRNSLIRKEELMMHLAKIISSDSIRENGLDPGNLRKDAYYRKKKLANEKWRINGDLAILTACANGWIPWRFSSEIIYSNNLSDNPSSIDGSSAIRRLPANFFISTFCNNDREYRDVAANTAESVKGVNAWLNDLCIANIDSCRRFINDSLLMVLKDRFIKGVKLTNPEYINQKVYPDDGIKALIIYEQPITDMDIVRVRAMSGEKDAMERLEQYYRANDAIGEMAFYYYFQALSENEPDKLFKAAQMMYEASAGRPYALAGMLNMLKVGKRMGSEQCATALDEIYQVAQKVSH